MYNIVLCAVCAVVGLYCAILCPIATAVFVQFARPARSLPRSIGTSSSSIHSEEEEEKSVVLFFFFIFNLMVYLFKQPGVYLECFLFFLFAMGAWRTKREL
jgi:hypothetical protein